MKTALSLLICLLAACGRSEEIKPGQVWIEGWFNTNTVLEVHTNDSGDQNFIRYRNQKDEIKSDSEFMFKMFSWHAPELEEHFWTNGLAAYIAIHGLTFTNQTVTNHFILYPSKIICDLHWTTETNRSVSHCDEERSNVYYVYERTSSQWETLIVKSNLVAEIVYKGRTNSVFIDSVDVSKTVRKFHLAETPVYEP